MRGKSETNFWWSVVVRGGPSQTLTDQVILFQPGGQVLPTTLLLSSPPPDFLTFLRHWHVKTMGLLFTQHMLQENYFSLVTNFRVKEVKSKVLLTYFFKRTKSTLLKFYSKIAVNTKAWVATVFCVARTFILWWSRFAPARAPFLLKIKFRGHFYDKKSLQKIWKLLKTFLFKTHRFWNMIFLSFDFLHTQKKILCMQTKQNKNMTI